MCDACSAFCVPEKQRACNALHEAATPARVCVPPLAPCKPLPLVYRSATQDAHLIVDATVPRLHPPPPPPCSTLQAKIIRQSWLKQGALMVINGGLAAGASYLVGWGLQQAVGRGLC